jgi:outer membrane lipoprotein-sorting protein
MNVLRRLPLYRLLILCGVLVAVGVAATAIALAVAAGPKPAPKPLPQAIHDALSAPAVEGVSANITLTNRLLEGASLASGSGQAGELTSNPLLAGGSGRLWVSKDGRVRLELQAEKGDTQVIWDGHTISAYDAASNTLYRYTPSEAKDTSTTPSDQHSVPSVAKIEEAISHLEEHTTVASAPSDVAGRPTYTVQVAPRESGSLLGRAELSFDADNGAPLRAAIYSTTGQSPVIELAATEVSFGPVAPSVFEFTPPAGAKVQELHLDSSSGKTEGSTSSAQHPTITGHGSGPSTIGVLEEKLPVGSKQGSNSTLEALPKVNINGASASELRTELGTLLSFERSGVRYVLAGAVSPAALEALARGL